MNKKRIISVIVLSLITLQSFGQQFTVSTNGIDWLNLGTINAKASVSFARNFTAEIGGKYNGWSFTKKSSGLLIENRQTSFSAGVRYWPWYVNSGWWVALKGQYKYYRMTGLWRYAVNESKGVGASVSGGYAFMVTPHFNIDLGLGVWGGRLLDYNLYHCPRCMELRESGARNFIDLDEISVSFVFIL